MTGGRRGPNKIFSLVESDVTSIGTTIILDDLDLTRPHCFAGVQFFLDAAGLMPAVPTAGSVVVTAQTINSQPVYETVPGGVITASDPTTATWSGNTKAVKAIPSGVDVATHYKLILTFNET